MKRRMREGFTLIELLVVVLIIASLAAIGTPQYFKVVEKARIVEVNALLTAIRSSQEGLMAQYGAYAHNNAQITRALIALPGKEPAFGMRYFFVVIGKGSPDGCDADDQYYNVQFIRYGKKARVPKRYYKNYMMIYERCTNEIAFPGCPNCVIDFQR